MPRCDLHRSANPLLLLGVTTLLFFPASCATWKAIEAYPEATMAILEGLLADLISVFTFFL